MAQETERAELHRTMWRIANDLYGSSSGRDFKAYVLCMLFHRFIFEDSASYIDRHWRSRLRHSELSGNAAEAAHEGIVAEKGLLSTRDLFADVRTTTGHDDLTETLARIFGNIEASAIGATSRACPTTST